MNGFDDDPIGPHAHRRMVSDSPENVSRRCPLAGDDSDSDSSDSEPFRVESTGIFMLSLPDSFEEKDDNTPLTYQTPPEELAPVSSDGRRPVAVDVAADANGAEVTVEYVDDGKAVDLGRDTDVGLYSEIQSTPETGEKDKSIEIIGVRRSHSFEAKKFGLPSDESEVSLGESSSKKLRLSEEALGSSSCARTVCKLKGMDDGKVSNGDNGEIHCNYKEKSAEKDVKESVKSSKSHQSSKLQEEMGNRHRSVSRLLLPSISGVKTNAAGKKFNTTSENPIEVTLLEILEILKGEEKSEFDDESLSKLSILDIVQRRGMTFPRPEWWPPEV